MAHFWAIAWVVPRVTAKALKWPVQFTVNKPVDQKYQIPYNSIINNKLRS